MNNEEYNSKIRNMECPECGDNSLGRPWELRHTKITRDGFETIVRECPNCSRLWAMLGETPCRVDTGAV